MSAKGMDWQIHIGAAYWLSLLISHRMRKCQQKGKLLCNCAAAHKVSVKVDHEQQKAVECLCSKFLIRKVTRIDHFFGKV
jgi:hypothetical protein